MQKFLAKLFFGEPQGETIDLTYGTLRVARTVEPDEKLGFNEFWTSVYAENKRLNGY
jgi:hypothetical protein